MKSCSGMPLPPQGFFTTKPDNGNETGKEPSFEIDKSSSSFSRLKGGEWLMALLLIVLSWLVVLLVFYALFWVVRWMKM
jgi:hypothetical protein